MADITDPTLVAFCNEVVRPLSDHLVGLKASIDARMVQYDANVRDTVTPAANGDDIIDGSQSDGRAPLTIMDLKRFIIQVELIQELLDGSSPTQTATGAFAMEYITKPMVNPRYPV